MDTFLNGLKDAALMAYQVWWALVLGFVCSVGNVPLAAVLWSGGI